MQIPFVGFMPVRTSEHMAALEIFGCIQFIAFTQFVRSLLPSALLLRVFLITIFLVSLAALTVLTLAGTRAAGPAVSTRYRIHAMQNSISLLSRPVSEHLLTPLPKLLFDLS